MCFRRVFLPARLQTPCKLSITRTSLVSVPAIAADAVYSTVLACHPARNKFNIDVDLRAVIRSSAVRELALYRSLESRAAARVKEGVTEASEQVSYLEKVASSQEKLIEEEAKIMESRLLLSGMCDPKNAKQIGGWLKKVSAVPEVDE